MAIFPRYTRPGGWPTNASAGWSFTVGFWRASTQVVPDLVRFYNSVILSPTVVLDCPAIISGGMFGQGYPGSSSYCNQVSYGQITVDVWKSLADAAWASLTIDFYAVKSSGLGGTHVWGCGPANAANPSTKTKSAYLGTSFPLTKFGTAVFSPDGTFTFP
jgi:hypothetical protein